jgi:hypothetical protein
MISKPIPPFSGLIDLIIGCIADGIIGTLILVPISINTKFEGSY